MFERLMGDLHAREAALRDRIGELERQKATAAAEQAHATAEWEAVRHQLDERAGKRSKRRRRAFASEVALARYESPSRGSQHLGFAKALVYEMPHTLAALQAGALTEWRATLIVRESACLTVEDRARLDHELCSDPIALEGRGDARIAADAKTIAYRLDPHAVVERAVRAPRERRVGLRPAPDAMVYLTALLPMPQGVATYASLKREADTTFDDRGHGQVMADTLVERVTGRPAQEPVPVTVNLVISDETLVAGGDAPATVDGYGPIPGEVARQLIDTATDAAAATLRRLYATPGTGSLVAMESRGRQFPKALARFIRTRDQTCRTPYCDAPIRHIDHAHPDTAGGPTTALNGEGKCEHCNYVKEQPGWQVRTILDKAGRHVAEHTTPTGVTYRSTAPPVPSPLRILTREFHAPVHIAINVHAA